MNRARRELPTGQTLRLYLREAAKNKKQFRLSLLLPIGGTLMGVAAPYFASRVLAGLITQRTNLWFNFYGFLVSSVLGLLANLIGIRNNMVLQARTMESLNNLVFDRLLKRSVGFYSNRVSGKLVSDTLDFINGFGALISAAYFRGSVFALNLIVGLIVIFFNAWQLGLVIFILFSILSIWTYTESRKRAALRADRLRITKALTSHLSDSLVNAVTVKNFARESYEIGRNSQLSHELANARESDWQRTTTNENLRISIIIAMQIILIFVLIKVSKTNHNLIATGFFAFTYTITVLNRFFELNTITRQIEESLLQAAPSTQMLLEDIEISDKPDAKPLKVRDGAIAFNHVQFAYQDSSNESAVFNNLSLSIKAGERIGLVGPSGGGKSTLTRLLLRYDDIQAGGITIDQQDVRDVTQTSLRQAIAYVPQEPLLFHRTIAENISYGRPDAALADIQAAAKQAFAHDFVEALPHGYDTIVGERGVKLSGGQRQRIAIARAILKDAPILVLDEATSALDSESEALIQKALWKLMQGRTAIVIAHRLSTIQKMDRIVVLEEGNITQQGTHKALLKASGTYAKLWKHQSGGFIEE